MIRNNPPAAFLASEVDLTGLCLFLLTKYISFIIIGCSVAMYHKAMSTILLLRPVDELFPSEQQCQASGKGIPFP